MQKVFTEDDFSVTEYNNTDEGYLNTSGWTKFSDLIARYSKVNVVSFSISVDIIKYRTRNSKKMWVINLADSGESLHAEKLRQILQMPLELTTKTAAILLNTNIEAILKIIAGEEVAGYKKELGYL